MSPRGAASPRASPPEPVTHPPNPHGTPGQSHPPIPLPHPSFIGFPFFSFHRRPILAPRPQKLGFRLSPPTSRRLAATNHRPRTTSAISVPDLFMTYVSPTRAPGSLLLPCRVLRIGCACVPRLSRSGSSSFFLFPGTVWLPINGRFSG
jgi:hypothetical protein